eukprot:gnl/Chilomastix_cuspidata/4912.p1 GENE.gnl/Chilomastix_cuspidata/4912~~gnl/Chilomastix_cuspidata/4912.p1  ORF type:complete len:624 (+),score=188.99 gnl/Chilomastix_cuspidata/4912:1-1872(+)
MEQLHSTEIDLSKAIEQPMVHLILKNDDFEHIRDEIFKKGAFLVIPKPSEPCDLTKSFCLSHLFFPVDDQRIIFRSCEPTSFTAFIDPKNRILNCTHECDAVSPSQVKDAADCRALPITRAERVVGNSTPADTHCKQLTLISVSGALVDGRCDAGRPPVGEAAGLLRREATGARRASCITPIPAAPRRPQRRARVTQIERNGNFPLELFKSITKAYRPGDMCWSVRRKVNIFTKNMRDEEVENLFGAINHKAKSLVKWFCDIAAAKGHLARAKKQHKKALAIQRYLMKEFPGQNFRSLKDLLLEYIPADVRESVPAQLLRPAEGLKCYTPGVRLDDLRHARPFGLFSEHFRRDLIYNEGSECLRKFFKLCIVAYLHERLKVFERVKSSQDPFDLSARSRALPAHFGIPLLASDLPSCVPINDICEALARLENVTNPYSCLGILASCVQTIKNTFPSVKRLVAQKGGILAYDMAEYTSAVLSYAIARGQFTMFDSIIIYIQKSIKTKNFSVANEVLNIFERAWAKVSVPPASGQVTPRLNTEMRGRIGHAVDCIDHETMFDVLSTMSTSLQRVSGDNLQFFAISQESFSLLHVSEFLNEFQTVTNELRAAQNQISELVFGMPSD